MVDERGEIEKSVVVRREDTAVVCLGLTWRIFSFAADRTLQLPRQYDPGNIVQLGVLENRVRRAKKMEVVRADLKGGKWIYQLRPSVAGNRKGQGKEVGKEEGGKEGKKADGEALHRGEDGNDWFKEDDLDWA
jgi:hypothetical protein